MNAIILAAGKGSRISEKTGGLPKSFLKINGTRIFDHQINAINALGTVKETVVVIGYQGDLFETEYKQYGITFIRNPFYDRTNVLGSLWFAREYLTEGFYFMHADTFYEPSILADLEKEPGVIVLCVEKKATVAEDMRVIVKNRTVRQISKTLPCDEAFGEFTGLAKISPKIAPLVCAQIRHRIERMGSHDEFFEIVIQDLIDRCAVEATCLDIGKRISVEIDFPEDYEQAKMLAGVKEMG